MNLLYKINKDPYGYYDIFGNRYLILDEKEYRIVNTKLTILYMNNLFFNKFR